MRIKIFPGITFHWGSKDGGPDSRVYMYGIECKWAASALVLRFLDGSRDAYHSHAFNAISWVLGPGYLRELAMDTQSDGRISTQCNNYHPSLRNIFTSRACTHKVFSRGTTYVVSLRGPWAKTWTDIDGQTGQATTLRSGRVVA